MVNSEELLAIVDEYDVPQEPKTRREAFAKGLWRRTVHVWIVNSKKQLLCQKRSLKKDISPGLWESQIGGHIGPTDNYFTGAVREVREETGLPVTVDHLHLIKIYKDETTKEYRGIFICYWDAEEDHIQMEEDEVDEIKFMHLQDVKKRLLEAHPEWILPGYEKEMFLLHL
jgi:isopentenyldiphosphate isomerase